MRRFADWQIQWLRNCLRAYHQYQYHENGRYYTWQDVREAIAVYTGLEIGGTGKKGPRKGAERLRQFVEGNNDRANPGQKKFPVPKPATLNAIYNFVTHEDIKLLLKGEMEGYIPDIQTPLRLLEYLYQRSGTQQKISLERFEGWYQSVLDDEDRQIRRLFELIPSSDSGLMHVNEWETFYDVKDPFILVEGYGQDRQLLLREQAEPISRSQHRGWAVLTPEDNLFLFLKNTRNGRNRYYFTTGTNLAPWNDEHVTRLALLKHTFPVEMFDDKSFQYYYKLIGEEMTQKIVIFEHAAKERTETKEHEQSETVEG